MKHIREYKRPSSVAEAQAMLGPGAAYLAGGTRLVSGKDPGIHTVIDIGRLGLDAIAEGSIGATARLQDVLEASGTPDVLRQALRHHLPWTWRSAATAAGECIHGGAENDWLVALLALDGRLVVDGAEAPIANYAGGLVTEIRYRQPRSAAFVKLSRVRTDKAIVNAAAALFDDGPILVVGGVAARPVVVHGTELPPLHPADDFRGSAEYRRQVAPVVAERALQAAGVVRP
jgi:CO/xanthine dehydrogenase FAD-binding subunit